jgi:carboxyl-terminal processing protease
MEDGFVKVVAPIDDTPAARAGLKPGDLIIKLDETAVKGMSLNDAVKRMRGKPNSNITLTVVRKGEAAPFTVTLTRAVIKIQSVRFKLIEPDFGYVRISQFQEHTGETLVKAVDGLYKQNQKPLRGLVLDLRNDPGGLLNGAVAVSAAFLPQNSLVVYTDGRTEDAKMKLNASSEFYLRGRTREDYIQKLPPEVKNVPMVVLVNGGSASASEIVAGALQDHKRATIIGTQTFGKGSVQTIMPLGNNTAIKLTTARYYTPNGRSIQAKGITPDLIVEDPFNPSDQALRMREADLGRHLLNDREGETPGATPKPEASAAPTEGAAPQAKPRPKPKPLAPGEIVSNDDFQVLQALNHLKGEKVLAKAP